MLLERTCDELAAMVGGCLVGHCEQKLNGVSSLKEAMSTDVSFLGNEKYRSQVMPSKAGVVLVPKDFTEQVPEGRAWIVCENPSKSFSDIVCLFTPPPVTYSPGIAKSALISPTAEIGEGVHIGENVVIGDRVKVGGGTVLLAGVVLCQDVVVGSECLLYPHVVIRERCLVGDRVVLHAGVVLGSDGFGYDSGPEGHKKVPQVGIVQIDDDVEIGSNACVDRARFGRTWVQRGTKIDNMDKVGHNVVIGPHFLIVSQTGIAGSSVLGAGVIVAGQVGIAGHLHVGDGSILMAQSGLSKDVGPKSLMFGSPAKPRREYAKEQMYIAKIEGLTKELEDLKAKVSSLLNRS